MGFKEKMMERMIDKMSKEEKLEMMDKMMEKFFSGLSKSDRKELMKSMMPKMMENMFKGMSAQERQEIMMAMMPQMMGQMFGGGAEGGGGSGPMGGMMEVMMGPTPSPKKSIKKTKNGKTLKVAQKPQVPPMMKMMEKCMSDDFTPPWISMENAFDRAMVATEHSLLSTKEIQKLFKEWKMC